MIRNVVNSVIASVALSATGVIASAQSSSTTSAGTGPGPAVDPGVGDRPMGAGGRLQPTDLRQPVGFQQVYALPDGGFARQDGAITAVFQRSVYVNTRLGQRPTVPPGTVFRIGSGVPDWAVGAQPGEAAEPALRIATASALATDPRIPPEPAAAAMFASGTIFEDEFYRRVRVADLVLRASRVEGE